MYSNITNLPKHIHVNCIYGIGMSGLARLLLQNGHIVTGSDITNEDRNTIFSLDSQHKLNMTNDNELPEKTECLVVSGIIQKDNPQVKIALSRNIPVIHRMQAINIIFNKRKILAITGSQGKTSTSSILYHIIHSSFYIGGIENNSKLNSYYNPESTFACIESDESDASFRYLSNPYGCIVTNLNNEHLEFYNDSEDELIKTVENFIDTTHSANFRFLNIDNETLNNIYFQNPANFRSYGTHIKADYRAENIRWTNIGMIGDMFCKKEKTTIKNIQLNVFGEHMFINAIGALGLAIELGIDKNIAIANLKKYKGVERRMSYIGKYKGVDVVDDYGNNPVAFRAVLQTIKKVQFIKYGRQSKIFCVFEPHKYTRLKRIWNEVIDIFKNFSATLVLPACQAGEKPIKNHAEADFASQNPNFYYNPNNTNPKQIEESLSILIEKYEIKPGDVILCFGSGKISKHMKEVIKINSNNHS